MTTPVDVQEYIAEDGRNHFEDWLLGLRDSEARARLRARVNRVRLGNFGDCRGVGSGVHELRIDYGPGYRIYFGRRGNSVVILLCGGDKRTQVRDIEMARTLWQEYLRRKP